MVGKERAGAKLPGKAGAGGFPAHLVFHLQSTLTKFRSAGFGVWGLFFGSRCQGSGGEGNKTPGHSPSRPPAAVGSERPRWSG